MLSDDAAVDKFLALEAPFKTQKQHCDRLKTYWDSGFEMPWMPAGVREEYRKLVVRSRTNWLRLAVKLKSQRLTVDAVRTGIDPEADKRAWARWVANDMNARARRNNTTTMLYGLGAFTLWKPDGDTPTVMREESPRFLYAETDPYDPDVVLFARKEWKVGKQSFGSLIDDEAAYRLAADDKGTWRVVDSTEHAFGMTPVVLFRNEPDSEGGWESEIDPLIPTQQRIHETILDRLVAQKYGAFRQRWATGMVVEDDDDDDDDEDGQDTQPSTPASATATAPWNSEEDPPFVAGIDRLWTATGPVKFGEFSVTDLDPLIKAREADLLDLAGTAQIAVTYLYPGLSNVSTDTLLAAQDGMYSNLGEKQEYYDEPYAKLNRLAALGDGDVEIASSALLKQKWRDPRTYSPGVIADSLSKMSAIGVPLEFLLEKWGLDDTDIARVMDMREKELATKARAQAAAFGVDM